MGSKVYYAMLVDSYLESSLVLVHLCGNALAILGFANASGQGGAAALVDSFNS